MKLVMATVAAVVATTSVALAQTSVPNDPTEPAWPQRPVRWVVPFPPGSQVDVVARIVESRLTPRLGQPLVIDNRSGASGSIGVDAVAKATPDGYTVGLITVTTHAVAPNLGKKLPYDVIRDFAPVGMIGNTPYVLVTFPELPAKTVPELIALARAKPGSITYGSAGPASMAHLAAALFATSAGLDIVHLPYRSTAHAVSDIMMGRIQMQFATIAPTLPMIQSGQLRALATSSAKRSITMPDLPTVAQAAGDGALSGFDAALWFAMAMPAGVAPQTVARLNRELGAVLAMPDVIQALLQQGVETEPGTPQDLAARIDKDLVTWKDLIEKAKIRAE